MLPELQNSEYIHEAANLLTFRHCILDLGHGLPKLSQSVAYLRRHECDKVKPKVKKK